MLVDIVKKILAAQPVPADQVGGLIAGIGEALGMLRGRSSEHSAPSFSVMATDSPIGQRKRGRAVAPASRRAVKANTRHVPAPPAVESREPSVRSLPPVSPAEAPKPLAAIATAIAEPVSYPTITRLPTRGRGRPRSTGDLENGRARTPLTAGKPAMAEIGGEAEAVAAAEPQLPRLLRRSEIESPAPSLGGLVPTTAAEDVLHRGIVRWFDPKKQLGAVRIAGLAEGVAIDSETLRKAGIVRLYKGQEIEARVRIDGSAVELLSLSLAGTVATNSERAESLFGPRRQGHAPVVEMKRDALRKTAARLEAEQLFSRGLSLGQSTSEK